MRTVGHQLGERFMTHFPHPQGTPPVTEFDRWINEIVSMTGLERSQARRVLGSVSRGLSSRLPSSDANGLIDQLPSAVRQQMSHDLELRAGDKRGDFADEVCKCCPQLTHKQGERAIWAVVTVLSRHISPQWVRHARSVLPTQISTLWNTAA